MGYTLGDLGVARDNHANNTTQTALGVGGAKRTFDDYKVSSVAISPRTTPAANSTVVYSLTLTGGTYTSELQSSARANASWTVSGGTITGHTNSACTVQWGVAPVSIGVTWNDTYNPSRSDSVIFA